MFALFMFGSEVERLFGAKRYLVYYLVCVVGAALMHLIVVTARPTFRRCPTVGASGGVFGLLLAFGMAYPHRELIMLSDSRRCRCRPGCRHALRSCSSSISA